MLGLNKPNTEYPILMTWYPSEDNTKGIQKFSSTGKRIHCSYTKSSDISRLGLNQGVQSNSMSITTTTTLPIKINDKITYNGKTFIVKSIMEENSSISGGMWTNKASSIIKYLEIN